MRKLSPRVLRGTVAVAAAGAVAAAVLLPSTSTGAAPVSNVNSSAFGLSASLLGGTVTIPPLGKSTCPPGGTNTGLAASLGLLGGVGVSTGTTACDSAAGTSSATGTVANVALLAPALAATLVSATCSATATDPPTGSATLANATLAGVPVVANPGKNTVLVNIVNTLSIILNEQIPATPTTGGILTVRAIHIQIRNPLAGGALIANIILGEASCGPNVPVAAVDAFSFQNLPIILGSLAIVALLGYGASVGIRRARSTA